MRLVLDTNVVMSGLLWRGKPYELLQAIRHQHPRLQIYSSPVLLDELTEVISRPAFAKQLGLSGKSAHEVLADYLEVVELVEPIEIPRIVRDPDDDHVLACALTAQANLIVSGDRDYSTCTKTRASRSSPQLMPCRA
ncbi:MAG: putative toxin-antitoxin system toxin component, PIN family [Steroidobacteraceae bacterium]